MTIITTVTGKRIQQWRRKPVDVVRSGRSPMKNDKLDRMPDLAFRMMAATMAVKDRLFQTIDRRVETFQIREGMTLVD